MYGHQLLVPVPDLDRTQHFLVLGANPMASNGSLMTVPDFPARLRALKARDGRMVVVDPRRTETAEQAHEHHFVRPGTDALRAPGDAAGALRRGPRSLPRRTSTAWTPCAARWSRSRRSVAAARSGLEADVVRRLARDLAAAPSAAVYGRVGVSTQEFGLVATWAVNLLNLVTGNLDRPGGVMFTDPPSTSSAVG